MRYYKASPGAATLLPAASWPGSAERSRPAGTAAYDRDRDLPRLLALWPHEVRVATAADRHRLLARLRQALRAERRRGLAGHWTYDLARHSQLLAAYRAEIAAHLPPQQAGSG